MANKEMGYTQTNTGPMTRSRCICANGRIQRELDHGCVVFVLHTYETLKWYKTVMENN